MTRIYNAARPLAERILRERMLTLWTDEDPYDRTTKQIVNAARDATRRWITPQPEVKVTSFTDRESGREFVRVWLKSNGESFRLVEPKIVALEGGIRELPRTVVPMKTPKPDPSTSIACNKCGEMIDGFSGKRSVLRRSTMEIEWFQRDRPEFFAMCECDRSPLFSSKDETDDWVRQNWDYRIIGGKIPAT